VHFGLVVGEVPSTPPASVELKYVHGGGDVSFLTHTLAKDFQEKTSVVISAGFSIRPSVDAFALGELSGTVQSLLSLAKSGGPPLSELKYTVATKLLNEADGTRVFRVTLTFQFPEGPLDLIKRAIELHRLRTVSAKIDLSQSPTDPNSDTDFMQGQFALDIQSGRSLAIVIEEFTQRHRTRRPTLWRAGRSLSFDLAFDDLRELYPQLLGEGAPEEFHVVNWGLLKRNLRGPLSQQMREGMMPRAILEAYEKIEMLSGLHVLQVALGQEMVSLNFHGMSLFELLPTMAELRSS